MVNQTYQNTTKISEEISPNTDSSSSLTFFILLNPIVQKSAVADLILSHIRNVHFIWYLGCTFNVKYSFSALNSCPLQYLLNFFLDFYFISPNALKVHTTILVFDGLLVFQLKTDTMQFKMCNLRCMYFTSKRVEF